MQVSQSVFFFCSRSSRQSNAATASVASVDHSTESVVDDDVMREAVASNNILPEVSTGKELSIVLFACWR